MEGHLWHTKKWDTFHSLLGCKYYLCLQRQSSPWHDMTSLLLCLQRQLISWHDIILIIWRMGVMIHSFDDKAWKQFNRERSQSLMEPRNMRHDLFIDEFNPFESFTASYSFWTIILKVHNLYPRMCMRLKFMFLSTIILDSYSSCRNIDVYFQPLINELRQFIQGFHIWCLKEINFLNKNNFNVDYKWFSCVYDDFGMEHVWEISLSILYRKQ